MRHTGEAFRHAVLSTVKRRNLPRSRVSAFQVSSSGTDAPGACESQYCASTRSGFPTSDVHESRHIVAFARGSIRSRYSLSFAMSWRQLLTSEAKNHTNMLNCLLNLKSSASTTSTKSSPSNHPREGQESVRELGLPKLAKIL